MAPPIVSNTQIIKQLTTSWQGFENGIARTWDGPTVTFSLGDGGRLIDFGHNTNSISETAKATARLAFQQWNELSNLHLSEVSSGGDIRFNYSNSEDPRTAGTTVNDLPLPAFIGGNNQKLNWSDIWINGDQTSNQDPALGVGSYGLMTFEHEIGHALGLSHPAAYNATDGTSPTYAANAAYSRDTRQYTIMSYFAPGADGSGADYGGFNPQTPMVDDIMAIQSKYGANMSTRSGDTVYGFNSNITGGDAKIFDFSQNAHPVFSIWDAGGNDTIDTSGFSAAQTINLAAGAYSDIGGLKKNVGIANNVTIENAIGGSGADTMTGNAAANSLIGGGGADTLNGAAGLDYLAGGLGNDTYVLTDINLSNGVMAFDTVDEAVGEGIDTVKVQAVTARNPLSGLSVTLSSYTLGDNVENGVIVGGNIFDLTGNALANNLTGNGAANTLSAGAGADLLNGAAGFDTLIGGTGNDTYTLTDASSVRMFNPAGFIDFVARYDAVQEDAGGGLDTVNVSRATTTASLLAPSVTLTSYTLGDNVENGNVTGAGDFDLTGNGLANVLTGNVGVNTLNGGDGDDKLNGLGAFDTLIGGAGADTYVLGDVTAQSAAGSLFASFDTVIEASGGGMDTVQVGRASVTSNGVVLTATSYTLADNVENATVSGTTAFNLSGNGLDNRLIGNGAINVFEGFGGNDIISGGAGADTFNYLSASFGNDVITDFAAGAGAGHDVLALNRLLAADFTSAMADFAQVGANAVMTLGGNGTITLNNVNVASLTAADFQFV